MTVNATSIARLYKCPDTIDATGATDVWDEMTAWMATIPNDDCTWWFPPNAVYLMDKQIPIYNPSNLQIAGNLARFKFSTAGVVPADRERSNLMLLNADNCEIRQLVCEGAFPAGAPFDVAREAQHGFEIVGAHNTRLIDCQSYNTYGDFFYFGIVGPTDRYAQDCTVIRHIGYHSGRQGAATIRCDGLVIENYDFDLVGRSCFDLEPTGSWLPAIAERVVIRNGRVRRVGTGNFVSAAADQYTQHVWVVDNVCDEPMTIRTAAGTANGTQPLQLNHDWNVLRNQGGGVASAPHHSVVRLHQTTDSTVRDNYQQCAGGMYFASYQGTHTNDVSTANTVPGASGQWWFEDPGYPPGAGNFG